MTLAIIVACSRNRVIGRNNSLPWHLPEDLKHFKALTMGKPMIMGRKTFESIGRPLPGRTTLVVTRQTDWRCEGVVVCHSLEEAITRARDFQGSESREIMIVGGEEIYRQCLPHVDTVYLTEVAVDVNGDAFFPELDETVWSRCSEQTEFSESSGLKYSFIVFKKQ